MSAEGHAGHTREDEHPEINISRIRVGGDLGGLIFVVGMVACILIGIPASRGFFGGTLAGGVALAALLAWRHRPKSA